MLANRLMQIKKAIGRDESVADIGTDHARLLIALTKTAGNNHPKLIGTDISAGPLKYASDNLRKFNLQNKIFLRVGNGLEPLLPGEVDTVVLSGLGGYKVVDILSRDLRKTKSIGKFLLQPHQDIVVLRKWLLETGFSIAAEDMVLDKGKYYFLIVMKTVPSAEKFTPLEIELGPLLLRKKHPGMEKFLAEEIERLLTISQNINRYSKRSLECEEVDRRISEYGEVLQWLRS